MDDVKKVMLKLQVDMKSINSANKEVNSGVKNMMQVVNKDVKKGLQNMNKSIVDTNRSMVALSKSTKDSMMGINNSIKSTKTSIATLNKTTSEGMRGVKVDIKSTHNHIDNMGKSVRNTNTMISSTNRRIDSMGQSISKLSGGLRNNSKHIEDTSRSLTGMNSTLKGTHKSIADTNRRITGMGDKLKNMNKSMNDGMSNLDKNMKDMGKNFNKSLRDMDREVRKSTKSMDNSFRRLGNTIMSVFAVSQLYRFGRASVKVASDLIEVQNIVDVTFGKSKNAVDEFAESAYRLFGISELSAKWYAGTFGALIKGSGFAEDEIKDMAINMTKLSGDLASFYNLEGDIAYNKILSGLAGETKPLRELGINLNIANLEAYALSKGINQSYNSMSQKEKTMLRYKFILEKTADAQGDFLRTNNDWANQSRILILNLQNLMMTIGTSFISVFRPVLIWVNTLIERLVVLLRVFETFVQKIFGPPNATNVMGGVVDPIYQFNEVVEDGIGNVGEAASKGIKDMKNSMSGFDELVSIDSNKGGDIAGVGGVDIGGVGSMPMEIDLDINEEGITPKLDELNSELIESMKKIGDTIKRTFDWLKSEILIPFMGWFKDSALPAIAHVLHGAFGIVVPIIESFGRVWDSTFKGIASWTGSTIVDWLWRLGDALKWIGDWMVNNPGKVDVMTKSVIGFFAAWKLWKLSKAIIELGRKTYSMALLGKELIKLSVTTVVSIGKMIVSWGSLFATKTKDIVVTTMLTVKKWAYTAATSAATIATKAFGLVMVVATSKVTLIILAIAALVIGITHLIKNWDKVRETSQKVWDSITKIWGIASGWFKDVVIDPIVSLFSNMGKNIAQGFSNAFENIGGIIKVALNIWRHMIESFINGVLNGFNIMIRGLNKLNFKVPDWVPGIGGGEFGFALKEMSHVSIPKLAKGGIVSTATQFIAGEAGAEVVFPLQNSKFIEDFARYVADSMRTTGDGSTGGSVFNIGTLVQDDRSYEWLADMMAKFMARNGYLSNG